MILWQRRLQEPRSRSCVSPEGKDPDELIRRDPASWPGVVATALPFLDFYVDAALAGIDPADARGEVRGGAPARPAPAKPPATRSCRRTTGRRSRGKLQHPESSVIDEAIRSRGAHRRALSPETLPPTGATASVSNEDHLLALLLRHRADLPHVLPLVPIEVLTTRATVSCCASCGTLTSRLSMAPEMIVAGLDDAVADHAEAFLETSRRQPRPSTPARSSATPGAP